MSAVIDNYQYLSSLMGQMREAAARGEWDQLVELEQQCGQRVESLKALDASEPLNEGTRQQKVALIKKILADDAEIRNLTQPWMAQLQNLITGVAQERRVQQTYSEY